MNERKSPLPDSELGLDSDAGLGSDSGLDDLPSEDELELDEVDVRDLLRSALVVPDQDEREMTRRVQKRIREESRGRYFADGWSTASAPRATFLVTSALMLLVVILVWWLLGPTAFHGG